MAKRSNTMTALDRLRELREELQKKLDTLPASASHEDSLVYTAPTRAATPDHLRRQITLTLLLEPAVEALEPNNACLQWYVGETKDCICPRCKFIEALNAFTEDLGGKGG